MLRYNQLTCAMPYISISCSLDTNHTIHLRTVPIPTSRYCPPGDATGDRRKPPSKYGKEEFLNNVLPRASENQPPRILNELRQLSCRLVASGIAKGLLKEQDLPHIRRILVGRFQVYALLSA